MLTQMPNVRVFVCTQATDMRKSYDGLSGMVEEVVKQSPLSGHLFVFRNRRGDKLKILYWVGDGLCIWAKRLEAGTFELPLGKEGGKEAMPMDKTRAQTALGFIRLLYDTEALAQIAGAETRRTLRQKHSRPVLAKFKEWLDGQALVVLPKSAMGEAIGYALNQWGP